MIELEGKEITLAAVVKDARKTKFLTLDQLAEESEIGKSTLSEIESGKNKNPTKRVLAALNYVLEIDAEILLAAD